MPVRQDLTQRGGGTGAEPPEKDILGLMNTDPRVGVRTLGKAPF